MVCKQHKTRLKVLEAYSKVKQALKTMGDEYVTSKETRNVLVRYRLLRQMVKQVIILERLYWTLVDVPKQEVKESPADYVNRHAILYHLLNHIRCRLMSYLEQRVESNQSTSAADKSGTGLFGSSSTVADKVKEASTLEALKCESCP
jgi:hypothetical protein